MYPIQYARIGAALLQGLAKDRRIQANVAKFVSMARARGIHTIGDRIEDAATMVAASKIGIEYAQGD